MEYLKKSLSGALCAAIILLSPGLPAYQAAAQPLRGAGASNPWVPVLRGLTTPEGQARWSQASVSGIPLASVLSSLAPLDWNSPQGQALAASVAKRLPANLIVDERGDVSRYALLALARATASARSDAKILASRATGAKTVGELKAALGRFEALAPVFPLLSPGQRGVSLAHARSLRARLTEILRAQAQDTVARETQDWIGPDPELVVEALTPLPAPMPLMPAEVSPAPSYPPEVPAVSPRTLRSPAMTRRAGFVRAFAVGAMLGVPAALLLAASTPAVLAVGALAGAGLIASMVLHESAHLWVLRRLGDDTAARNGVASLNPLRLIDPVTTVLLPLATGIASWALFGVPVVLGWAKPIPVDFNRLADPKKDALKVAIAGPLMNFALAGLGFAALALLHPAGAVGLAVGAFAKMNLGLALFNLLPLPQLDGGKVLVGLLPQRLYRIWISHPGLPSAYQSTFNRLYEGPANILTRLGLRDQRGVNRIALLVTMTALVAFTLLSWGVLGLPAALLILACSYDYHCIREKIVNEKAVQDLMAMLQGFTSELVRMAEQDKDVLSEVESEDAEHALKEALENTIDQVVDSEGFAGMEKDARWARLEAAYLDAAVAALKERGMTADSPETIRRLLTSEAGRTMLLGRIRAWVEENEVFEKWRSPGRKASGEAPGAKLKIMVKAGGALGLLLLAGMSGVDVLSGGFAAIAGTLQPAATKHVPFAELLRDESLRLSASEKGLLTSHFTEMKLDKKAPVTGRLEETSRLLNRLLGPRGVPSSAILIGKSGVGKTAIPQKIAQALALADERAGGPAALQLAKLSGRYLLRLDLASLLTEREPDVALKAILKAVERINETSDRRGNRIIVFIDEVHQLFLHSKGEAMSNMLLEPLQSGTITFALATTRENHRRFIEKDEALNTRLMPVMVEEPDAATALGYLKGARSFIEALYGGTKLQDDALKAAAEDSQFDQDSQLPRKAFDFVYEAMSAADFDTRRDLSSLAIQDKMGELHYAMERLAEAPEDITLHNAALALSEELLALYRGRAAIPMEGTPSVDADQVRAAISRKTGITVGQLSLGREPMEKYLRMEDTLNAEVVGQKEAVSAISEAVRASKAGLQPPEAPIASFLFTGPTGVGKTYLAKRVAAFVFGSEDAMTRLDMSEYMHDHEVSKMIGAPPGYVGYDQGGHLTEAVRKKPHSVVLLDEIEKASPAAWLMLLQVLGEARLTDGKGRLVSFKNTIVMMTSNVGMMMIDMRQAVDAYKALQGELRAAQTDEAREAVSVRIVTFAEALAAQVRVKSQEATDQAVPATFPPEFIGRLSAPPIVMNPLSREQLVTIAELELRKLSKLLGRAGHALTWDEATARHLAYEGYSPQYGARPLNGAIRRLVTQPLATEILKAAAAAGDKVSPSLLALSLEDGRVRIAVSPLPVKAVEKAAPAGDAAAALFAEVFGAAMKAAARAAEAAWPLETMDGWVTRALSGAPAPAAEEPLPDTEPAPPAPAGLFSFAPAPSMPNRWRADLLSTPGGKDPGLEGAREALAAELAVERYPSGAASALLRTREEAGAPFVGWLKLFARHAKRMTPAALREGAVVLTASVNEEKATVVIRRPGRLEAGELALLRAHFEGAALSGAEAREKAEQDSQQGEGRRLYHELHRALEALPGARLGAASAGEFTEYWIELPKPPSGQPERLRAAATRGPDGPGDPGGQALARPQIEVGARGNSVALDIRKQNEEDPGFQAAFRRIAASAESPAMEAGIRGFLDRAARFAKEEAREHGETVHIAWTGTPDELKVAVIREFPGPRHPFRAVSWLDALRDEPGLIAALTELKAYIGSEPVEAPPGRTAQAVVLELSRGAGVKPPDSGSPESGGLTPAPRGLRGMTRAFILAFLDQGEQRGPTSRIAAADALAALSARDDLGPAREWIRWEDMARRHPEVAAAALIIARHGTLAEDERALLRAMGFLAKDSYRNDVFKPAKRRLSGALAELLVKDESVSPDELLARYQRERDKPASSGRFSPGRIGRQRNELVLEALYLALSRRGGADAAGVLQQDLTHDRIPALYAFLERTSPDFVDALLAEGRAPTGALGFTRKLLFLEALSRRGTAEDLPFFLGVARGQWDLSLDSQTRTLAAEAFGRFVARTGTYEQVKQELRLWMRGSTLHDDVSFTRLVSAIQAAGEAGGTHELVLLDEIIRANPEEIDYVHEMSQHEAALAWGKIAVRRGLMEKFLTENLGAGEGGAAAMPRIQTMLADRNSVVVKAAFEALAAHFNARPPAWPAANAPVEDEPAEPAATPAGEPEAAAPAPLRARGGFFQMGPPPAEQGAEISAYYGTYRTIAERPESGLAGLPQEVKGLAMTWARQWQEAAELALGVPLERSLRVARAPNGAPTITWVLRALSGEVIPSDKIARLGELAVLLLDLRASSEDRRRLLLDGQRSRHRGMRPIYETLSRLAASAGTAMGLDHDPARRGVPQRGEVELWLSLTPAPSGSSAPTPYRDGFGLDPDLPYF